MLREAAGFAMDSKLAKDCESNLDVRNRNWKLTQKPNRYLSPIVTNPQIAPHSFLILNLMKRISMSA